MKAKNKLPGGRTGKARTDGDAPGSVSAFSESPGYGATLKRGPSVSNPGPGNGSGSVPKGETLKPGHVGAG